MTERPKKNGRAEPEAGPNAPENPAEGYRASRLRTGGPKTRSNDYEPNSEKMITTDQIKEIVRRLDSLGRHL